MVKKLATLVALAGGTLGLTGCELNNDSMQDMINKCKEDVECKAIIDKEIDEALDERGILRESDFEDYYGDVYFDDYDAMYYELSEEEQVLLDAFYDLEDEYFEALDGMTDEELEAYFIAEFETVLGRELTAEELAAYDLIEALYETMEDAEYPEFETEQAFIEFYLGRELTTEEVSAVTIVENLWDSVDEFEDFDDEDWDDEDWDDMDWDDEDWDEEEFSMEEIVGRELTVEEETAIAIVEGLYEELDENFFEKEFEVMLGRELTDEEQAAFILLENVENEMYNNEESFEFDVTDIVADYETVLGRELTTDELDAINFVYGLDQE